MGYEKEEIRNFGFPLFVWERVQKGRLTPASQARVLKVLRFDAACGCEGCGIALSGDEYICPPAAVLPPEGEVCSILTLELT